MEADPASIQVGFKAAYGWSEYLWKGIFSSLPAAKAAKSDGATDFKLVMQALVAGAEPADWASLGQLVNTTSTMHVLDCQPSTCRLFLPPRHVHTDSDVSAMCQLTPAGPVLRPHM
jgi:hypothetical protein